MIIMNKQEFQLRINDCFRDIQEYDPKATIIIAVASPAAQGTYIVSTEDLNSLALARLITHDRERALLK